MFYPLRQPFARPSTAGRPTSTAAVIAEARRRQYRRRVRTIGGVLVVCTVVLGFVVGLFAHHDGKKQPTFVTVNVTLVGTPAQLARVAADAKLGRGPAALEATKRYAAVAQDLSANSLSTVTRDATISVASPVGGGAGTRNATELVVQVVPTRVRVR